MQLRRDNEAKADQLINRIYEVEPEEYLEYYKKVEKKSETYSVADAPLFPVTLTFKTDGNINAQIGQSYTVKGLGKFSRNYSCKKITHTVSGQGFETSWELKA
jgi:hypothetical protein